MNGESTSNQIVSTTESSNTFPGGSVTRQMVSKEMVHHQAHHHHSMTEATAAPLQPPNYSYQSAHYFHALAAYHHNTTPSTPSTPSTTSFNNLYVRDPRTGLPLKDARTNESITIEKMLSTKPLRSDISTRPGPGNRQLTYMSGESVTRTLNDIFGFDGWSSDIKNTTREVNAIR